VEPSDSLARFTAEVQRLRIYRLLANSFVPLLVVALALLLFRWLFPWTFSVLVLVWSVDALLLVVLAVPWLLALWAFAHGKIKCPSCEAPFASRFHLWVPKACQSCGYDVTTPRSGGTSGS
jgi:hypothetical protein